METLRCRVKKKGIRYYNQDNGYSIFNCEYGRNYTKSIVCKGTLFGVKEGQTLNLFGEYVDHDYNGFSEKQFNFKSYQDDIPSDTKGFIEYLSSGLFYGVGASTATTIVDYFGSVEDATLTLNEYPDRLYEIPGIGKKKIAALIEGWRGKDNQERKELFPFLMSCGLTENMCNKIYNKYRHDTKRVLETNPYKMIEDIDGIAFKKADDIAMKTGMKPNDPTRLKAAVVYLMEYASQFGHCYSTEQDIIDLCSSLIASIDANQIHNAIITARAAKLIYRENGVYWLAKYVRAERKVTSYIKAILSEPGKEPDDTKVEQAINNGRIEYAEEQANAIRSAAKNKIMILTGGPGTGKTTVTRGIVDMFENMGFTVALASPTGRAAKRLSEATDHEATTIHRLLQYNPGLGFQINYDNPLTEDVIIIDESSMIDIELMEKLCESINKRSRLILIGDADQLPSVGPGNVLQDLIECGSVPVCRLNVIFRQAQGSDIIRSAYKINHGMNLKPNNGATDSDFEYYDKSSAVVAADIVSHKVRELLDSGVSVNDIQVLFPQKPSPHYICVNEMNERMQNELNPSGEPVPGTKFRVGDKVMQIKNNHPFGVYNGDIGIVSEYDRDAKVFVVDFDGNKVRYGIINSTKTADKDQLMLAYACTVHKSQGSEYQYVIMPFMGLGPNMLHRNLLYTGVTRAKKRLILIADPKQVWTASKNNVYEPRRTMLKKRMAAEAEA